MILVLGGMLGAGVLLLVAPFLWPRERREVSRSLDALRSQLALAGFTRMPLEAFIAISLIVGIAGAALVHATIGIVTVTAIAGVAAALAAPLVIRRRAANRLRENRTAWPDVVDHLVAAVRSGLSLPDAVASLADHGPASLRPAFAAFQAEYRASGHFSAALDGLKHHLADAVGDRIIETLRMARDVGGNDLTTVLRGLATYLRDDAAVRAEVEARQSWIRNAARLGVAAPWIVLVLLASRPEAATAYDTPGGGALILVGFIITLTAYRTMVALGRLPSERRWFA